MATADVPILAGPFSARNIFVLSYITCVSLESQLIDIPLLRLPYGDYRRNIGRTIDISGNDSLAKVTSDDFSSSQT